MDLRIFVEPQMGATYDDQLAVALTAERCGFSGFFRADHFVAGGGRSGLPGPTDSWVTLGGLARDTTTIRLGTLLTSATFRLPGLLAIQVAQVDQMSGGRVEFGLGAGWLEVEHTAYGIEFPDVRTRFDRLEEQLEVVTGLWATPVGERFSHEGTHYRLTDSPALPKPVQSRVPVILGGRGPRRTPALAARYATEFNAAFMSADEAALQFERVRHACAEIGRDATDLTYSCALPVCVGRDDAEVARRAAAIGRDVDTIVSKGVGGTVQQVVDTIGRYGAAGVERFYLQVLDMSDLDHVDLVASEVRPQLG